MGETHVDYAQSLLNLGLVTHSQGKWLEAQAHYRQSADVFRRANEQSHPEYVMCLNNLAVLYRDLGQFGRASETISEVIELFAGRLELPEVIKQVQGRTRRFAKRQGTWFRGLSECRFIPRTDHDDPPAIVAQIAQHRTLPQSS